MERFLAGFIMLFLGIALVFLAVVILALSYGGEVRGFGFILIGPIPLVISGGAEAAYLLVGVFAAALAAIVIAILLMARAGRPQAGG